MSDKYIAKKYVAVSSLTEQRIKCPNCHQLMAMRSNGILYCRNYESKCKLRDVPYREVKSLTTIQRTGG